MIKKIRERQFVELFIIRGPKPRPFETWKRNPEDDSYALQNTSWTLGEALEGIPFYYRLLENEGNNVELKGIAEGMKRYL